MSIKQPPSAKSAVKPQWIARLFAALGYSINGLRAGWHETSLRQEYCLVAILVPLAFLLGKSWLETALLASSVLLVVIVELLNTAIEKTIDRISDDWHELSKVAKDMGSAAVSLSLIIMLLFWLPALYYRLL